MSCVISRWSCFCSFTSSFGTTCAEILLKPKSLSASSLIMIWLSCITRVFNWLMMILPERVSLYWRVANFEAVISLLQLCGGNCFIAECMLDLGDRFHLRIAKLYKKKNWCSFPSFCQIIKSNGALPHVPTHQRSAVDSQPLMVAKLHTCALGSPTYVHQIVSLKVGYFLDRPHTINLQSSGIFLNALVSTEWSKIQVLGQTETIWTRL